MNKVKSLALIALLALTLFGFSGCAVFMKQANLSPKIQLVKNQWISLPTPAELNLSRNASQVLSARYQKKSFSAQVQVEVSATRLVIVALGGWGGELFSIDYNGRIIKSSALPIHNKALGVDHTLADFILTHANTNLLRRMLRTTNITLVVKANQRIFMQNGQPIIIISYQTANPWQGTVVIKNLALDYQVKVTTVAAH